MKQEMMECQWHQLDHMQTICTSLQTDRLTMPSPITQNCLQAEAGCSSWHEINSVRRHGPLSYDMIRKFTTGMIFLWTFANQYYATL